MTYQIKLIIYSVKSNRKRKYKMIYNIENWFVKALEIHFIKLQVILMKVFEYEKQICYNKLYILLIYSFNYNWF